MISDLVQHVAQLLIKLLNLRFGYLRIIKVNRTKEEKNMLDGVTCVKNTEVDGN